MLLCFRLVVESAVFGIASTHNSFSLQRAFGFGHNGVLAFGITAFVIDDDPIIRFLKLMGLGGIGK